MKRNPVQFRRGLGAANSPSATETGECHDALFRLRRPAPRVHTADMTGLSPEHPLRQCHRQTPVIAGTARPNPPMPERLMKHDF